MKIWYSIRNGGDGSAYPVFLESKEMCMIDQKYMGEGWGESCCGYLTVESESPVTTKELITLDKMIEELEDEVSESWATKRDKRKLEDLKKLKGK